MITHDRHGRPLRQPTAQERARGRPLTAQERAQEFAELGSQVEAFRASTAAEARRTEDLKAKLARLEEAAKPKVKTKADYYQEIVATATRRFGELPVDQAVSAYLATAESVPIYQRYRKAPHAAPAPVTATDPLDGRGQAYREVVGRIDAAAAELRKTHPRLSHAEAVDQVVERDPQLFAEYRAAYRAECRTVRGI